MSGQVQPLQRVFVRAAHNVMAREPSIKDGGQQPDPLTQSQPWVLTGASTAPLQQYTLPVLQFLFRLPAMQFWDSVLCCVYSSKSHTMPVEQNAWRLEQLCGVRLSFFVHVDSSFIAAVFLLVLFVASSFISLVSVCSMSFAFELLRGQLSTLVVAVV
jgi:hypothetical protein